MHKVKILQRYQCGFCKRRSIKHVIEKHEKRCYRNPDRYCDYCDNKGFIEENVEGHGVIKTGNCPYCSGFDKDMLKSIEKREKEDAQ